MATKKKPTSDDFDPQELARTQSDVDDLGKKLATLENRVGNNERFADSFRSAVQKASVAKETIAVSIRESVKHDKTTRKEILSLVDEADGRFNARMWKGFGSKVWQLVLVIVAFLLGKFFAN